MEIVASRAKAPKGAVARLRTTVRPTSHGRPTQTDNPEKAAA
jgi:hypothetical protein